MRANTFAAVLKWLTGPVVVGLLEKFTGIGRRTFRRVRERLRRRHSLPKTTVVLRARSQHLWWHLGSTAGEPAMQVVGLFTVTNATPDREVRIIHVHLKGRPNDMSHVFTKWHRTGTFLQDHAIRAHETTEVKFDLWVAPPVVSEGETLRATVVFVDQYNRDHRAKGVVFPYK